MNAGRFQQPDGRHAHLRVQVICVAIGKKLYLCGRLSRAERPAHACETRPQGPPAKRWQRAVSRDAEEPFDQAAGPGNAPCDVGQWGKRAARPVEQVGAGKEALAQGRSVFQVVVVL